MHPESNAPGEGRVHKRECLVCTLRAAGGRSLVLPAAPGGEHGDRDLPVQRGRARAGPDHQVSERASRERERERGEGARREERGEGRMLREGERRGAQGTARMPRQERERRARRTALSLCAESERDARSLTWHPPSHDTLPHMAPSLIWHPPSPNMAPSLS
eukprot:1976786-Prymnesium_polylepis.1